MEAKQTLQALRDARYLLIQAREAGGDHAMLERVWCSLNEEFWAALEAVR